MDTTFLVLLFATVALGLWVLVKQPALFKGALLASAKLFGGVWPKLVIGFILAGLLEVLIPAPVLLRWMGVESQPSRDTDWIARWSPPSGWALIQYSPF